MPRPGIRKPPGTPASPGTDPLRDEPRAGRQYRSLLVAGGFAEVTVEAHTGVFTGAAMRPPAERLAEPARASGAISREQADGWLAEQRRRAETGRFLRRRPAAEQRRCAERPAGSSSPSRSSWPLPRG